MKVIYTLSLVLALGLFSIVPDARYVPSALPNQIAQQQQNLKRSTRELPENLLNLELKSARGTPFKLADYHGNVVVLSLWATWCLPCRVQTPVLVRLQTEFRSRGVKVAELSTEDPDASAANVRDWMRMYKVNYQVGWSPKELSDELLQGNSALPQVFIVRRDGKIAKRFIGFNRDQTPSAFRQAIEEALKEP
jgi:peroxiredoxin